MNRRNFLKATLVCSVVPFPILVAVSEEPKQVRVYFDNLIDVNTGTTLFVMVDRDSAIKQADGSWTHA